MIRHLALMMLLLFALVAPAMAPATTGSQKTEVARDCSSGTCFPTAVEVAGRTMPLRSASLLRHWGFRVYTAALYAPAEATDRESLLAPAPKRLVLHYHRSISRDVMIKGAEKVLSATPGLDLKALSDRLDRVNAIYRDVRAGDEYSITWEPERGTTIALNGVEQITVEGADFARAYFGIWLSERPLNTELRDKLLAPFANAPNLQTVAASPRE